MKLLKCLRGKIGCWKGATSISTKPSWPVDRQPVKKFLINYFNWMRYWQFLPRTSFYASPLKTGVHYLWWIITKSLNMPRTITPTQYRLLVYNTAVNLRLLHLNSRLHHHSQPLAKHKVWRLCFCLEAHISRSVFTGHDMHPLLYKFTPLPNNHWNLTTLNIGKTHNAVHRCGSLSYLKWSKSW
jgi:hypothetical protein